MWPQHRCFLKETYKKLDPLHHKTFVKVQKVPSVDHLEKSDMPSQTRVLFEYHEYLLIYILYRNHVQNYDIAQLVDHLYLQLIHPIRNVTLNKKKKKNRGEGDDRINLPEVAYVS
jgi:hypothetical protein